MSNVNLKIWPPVYTHLDKLSGSSAEGWISHVFFDVHNLHVFSLGTKVLNATIPLSQLFSLLADSCKRVRKVGEELVLESDW